MDMKYSGQPVCREKRALLKEFDLVHKNCFDSLRGPEYGRQIEAGYFTGPMVVG